MFSMLVAMMMMTPQDGSLLFVEDGSLLFVENGNNFVVYETDSTITHVAIILKEDDEFWVYESVMPKVRKIKLKDYFKEIEKLNFGKTEENKRKLWLANPKIPLTNNQKNTLKVYLEKQIGRKYSINGYFMKKSVKGIHCGELVGEALNLINYNYTNNPSADNPWDVWQKTKTLFPEREEIF